MLKILPFISLWRFLHGREYYHLQESGKQALLWSLHLRDSLFLAPLQLYSSPWSQGSSRPLLLQWVCKIAAVASPRCVLGVPSYESHPPDLLNQNLWE